MSVKTAYRLRILAGNKFGICGHTTIVSLRGSHDEADTASQLPTTSHSRFHHQTWQGAMISVSFQVTKTDDF